MITVTDKQIDAVLKKITAVKGKSHVLHLPDGSIIYGKLSRKQKKLAIKQAKKNLHVLHLPDGSIIYGKLSRKQKKLAIKQAKKNLKVMVDNLSHEINMRILERMKTEHPEYWEKKNIDKENN